MLFGSGAEKMEQSLLSSQGMMHSCIHFGGSLCKPVLKNQTPDRCACAVRDSEILTQPASCSQAKACCLPLLCERIRQSRGCCSGRRGSHQWFLNTGNLSKSMVRHRKRGAHHLAGVFYAAACVAMLEGTNLRVTVSPAGSDG